MSPAGAGQLLLLAPATFLLTIATPAAAAEPEALPAALTTMIREAHPKERKAIVDVAKRLYPASVEQIDDILRSVEAEARASTAGRKRRGFRRARGTVQASRKGFYPACRWIRVSPVQRPRRRLSRGVSGRPGYAQTGL